MITASVMIALDCIAAPGDAPSARGRHTVLWTGTQMLVWGGSSGGNRFFNDGGIYDPGANTWTAIPTTGAPGPRFGHSAVWTGTQMILWGGTTNGTPQSYFNDGGRFEPASGTWSTVTTTSAPKPRYAHTAAWTGSQMVVWGGVTNIGYSGEGMRYDPGADSIQQTSTNTVVVSWPSSASTRVLQTNTDLTSANWGDVLQPPTDDGTNRSFVDYPSNRLFYRLR